MRVVYSSPRRPDCTSVKKALRKQDIDAEVIKMGKVQEVRVPSVQWDRAYELVWGGDDAEVAVRRGWDGKP